MAGNTYLSPTAIAKEILRVLHGNLTFSKNCNKIYNDSFANSGATMSGKIGPTITIKYPNKYTVTDGAPLDLQDTVETSTTLSVNQQKHVGMYFTSQDLTLTIDDFSDRYIKPAALSLAAKIDLDGLALYKDVYQTVGETAAATTGGDPASALVVLKAKTKIDEANCPQDGPLTLVVAPSVEATMVNALTGLLNPQVKISDQYTKGMMGKDTLGADWYMDQNVGAQTYGTRLAAAGTLNGTPADGASTIAITGGGPNANLTFKKGDVFTMGTCYSVNPQTGASTGSLQWFVVTADSNFDGSGDIAALAIAPTIVQSGAKANMTGCTTGKVITFWGNPGLTAKQSLMYHRDAFTLATVDLILPKGIDMAAREVFDGISVRIARQYDINNDRMPTRIDVLYGYKTLYPQLACRLSS